MYNYLNFKSMKKLSLLLIMLAVLLSVNLATAQTRWSLEVDPVTFVFGGYSAHLRVQPAGSDHLLLGAGVYAMNMPSFMVDLNPENKGQGWQVRLNQGIGLFGEYFLHEVNRKWFLGGQLGWQQYKVKREDLNGQAAYANLLLMGYGGYVWQPFTFPLYIKFWGGLGYSPQISGSSEVDGQTYQVAPVTFFGTFHLGYTF